MTNKYEIPINLLHFLGTCIYGDPKLYYLSLNDFKRTELEKQGRAFALIAWLYRYLWDVLPEEKNSDYQKIYQSLQLKAVIGVYELKRLYRVLCSHGLRFVPIKDSWIAQKLSKHT